MGQAAGGQVARGQAEVGTSPVGDTDMWCTYTGEDRQLGEGGQVLGGRWQGERGMESNGYLTPSSSSPHLCPCVISCAAHWCTLFVGGFSGFAVA